MHKIEKENDYFFSKLTYRIISRPFAKAISETGITPNQVSFLSILSAATAGYFFAKGDWKSLAIGYVFLQITYLLDHVDGDLARFLGKSSRFGRWVDEITNKIHKFLVVLGISIGIFRTTSDMLYLVLGSVAVFLWFFAAYISETKKTAFEENTSKSGKIKKNQASPGVISMLRELPFALIVNNIFGFLILFNQPKAALWFICIISLNAFQQIYSTRKKSYSL